ncbi:hypothetical protein AB0M41_26275 [Streptomyces sp. NPDC051896]|uniref:hypothetical protein n=1 Tax=Streptomyces sp. NPDC051896 TaxID=3155416 RepID=UPI00344A4721
MGITPSETHVGVDRASLAGPGRAQALAAPLLKNGSSHPGQKAADRLTAAFPNTVMVHTPVHASWLNQVEICFSAVQRKALSPNDFTDLTEVRDRLRAFEDHYDATAQPFQWRFTTSDLGDLLARLDQHTADHHEEILCRTGSVNNPRRIYAADH